MQYKYLLILALTLLTSSIKVNACQIQKNKEDTLAYQRRGNNRCEGLIDRPVGSKVTRLVSFHTSNLMAQFPNTLKLIIPGKINRSPNIKLQSFLRNYIIDKVISQKDDLGHVFNLDSDTLKKFQKLQISFQSLNATASLIKKSVYVYHPVIFNNPSDKYVFVINSPEYLKFPIYQIRYNNRVFLDRPILTPRIGRITTTWKFGDAPAGLYELYVEDSKGRPSTFYFQHDPKWFDSLS